MKRAFFFFALFFSVVSHQAFSQQRSAIAGRVTDPSGAVIVQARVKLAEQAARFERTVWTGRDGSFRFEDIPEGSYTVSVADSGFSPVLSKVTVAAGEEQRVDISLQLAALAESMVVSVPRIAEMPDLIPGSVSTLDRTLLESSRVFTTSEAMRKVPGVHARDEEGFGLRPNIGIRGMNPTRSSKILLLEDGIPLSYAPYGDNASYYHPPIDRFASVEVLKGAGQILYGPATVSGVVNYLTPDPPQTPGGSLTLTGGTRDYLNGRFQWGGTWGDTGLLAEVSRKQGNGARENQRFGLTDANLKVVTRLGDRQSLTLKGNSYTEDSNVGYSGLRQDEYEANPRQNPFRNDYFYGDRIGASAAHSVVLNNHAILSTNIYGALFQRHWWRQSSNSNERPNDPACGGMANLSTTCGIQGRLRKYSNWGLEPHLRLTHGLFGANSETDTGIRVHFENQDRRQENGVLPTSRTGAVVESNVRRNQAYSAFLQNRFVFGSLAVTPGARVEHVRYRRTNNLANGGGGATGETELTQVVPGVGISYTVGDNLAVFGGVHRGFAPPRTEDIISNTGGTVELDSELSWNYELGIRGRLHPSASIEATVFAMDYENQVVPASLAGGAGALLTNGGETLHQGAEFSGRFDAGTALGLRHNVYVRSAYTYVPVAKFTGTRFSNISGFSGTIVTGSRLPYAPRHMLNTTLGYVHPRGFHALIEAVHVSDQFADDLNTIAGSANGQQGLIPGNTTWNTTFNYDIESLRAGLFVSVKNVLDSTYIVDRARGILPSTPRLVHAGLKFEF